MNNKFPPKRILVPMDLSGPSSSALKAAKSLARRCGSSLELVYVQDFGFNVPLHYPNGLIDSTPEIQEMREQYRRKCLHKLRQAVRDFPASRVKIRALWGLPAVKLADLARGKAADLVVMGTHGYAGLDRLLFGSVAEAVVRRATIPVLAVHERSAPPRLSRILVPCNMTPYAGRALAYALGLARDLHASVEILYVAPEGASRARALEQLGVHVESFAGRHRWLHPTLRIAQGDPRHAIMGRAKRGKFDLIVLSAHRRPFSTDFVLGSTVERVLRHSTIPVLAIPSVATERWTDVQLSMGGVPVHKMRVPI